MQRVVVINPKGGSGKTTVCINLASHFALTGECPLIMDYDVQGSSAHWVRKRSPTQAPIDLVSVFERDAMVSRTFELEPPERSRRIIIDTPAAIEAQNMPELTRIADKVLVPVLPSDIDIHACTRCVQNLLLVAKLRRNENQLGIIANRVRKNTLSSQSLMRFLDTLGIPIVATLRDSQNYVRAAAMGLGLEEMTPSHVADDLEDWKSLYEWLELPSYRKRANVRRGSWVQPSVSMGL
ncbi:MAG TPA: AAA family ATPase [Steroidobacteraceae bacterium]